MYKKKGMNELSSRTFNIFNDKSNDAKRVLNCT